MDIEQIKSTAKEKYGKNITDEQAAAYAEKYGKLSDNELENVSGGCDSGSGDTNTCPNCFKELATDENGNTYCPQCAGGGAKVM